MLKGNSVPLRRNSIEGSCDEEDDFVEMGVKLPPISGPRTDDDANAPLVQDKSPEAASGEEGTVENAGESPSAEPVLAAFTPSRSGLTTTTNSAKKNERGFYTTVLTLRCKASIRDLMEGKEPHFKIVGFPFEVPGRKIENEDKASKVHAQGNILLKAVRNGFPGTVGIRLGAKPTGIAKDDDAMPKLRGAEHPTDYSSAGVVAHHHAIVGDQHTYLDVDVPLAHSDKGDLTEKYARDYRAYLKPNSVAESVKRMKGNTEWAQVKVGSPVHDCINATRKKKRVALMKKATTAEERAAIEEDAAYQPLDVSSPHVASTGMVYAPYKEVGLAMCKVENAFATRVNYVPLYQALKLHLVNSYPPENKSGVKETSAWEWSNFGEKRLNHGNPLTKEQEDAMLDERHTLHLKLHVEHIPLDELAAKPTDAAAAAAPAAAAAK